MTAPHDFLAGTGRPGKPRTTGLTEIRGPYYRTIGAGAVEDLLDTYAPYIDWFKLPAPSVVLLPPPARQRIADACHRNDIELGAGGLVELVLSRGRRAVQQYFQFIVDSGFDILEISAGMVAIANDDFLRLVADAKKTGLFVKAEVGVQFGAGGTSSASALAAEGTTSVGFAIERAKAALDAGADLIVLESEGVTESVTSWRTDVIGAFVGALGLDQLLFEAADPEVFEWYVKCFGPDVNLFVDSSQVVALEALRQGLWGSHSTWNRIVSYPAAAAPDADGAAPPPPGDPAETENS